MRILNPWRHETAMSYMKKVLVPLSALLLIFACGCGKKPVPKLSKMTFDCSACSESYPVTGPEVWAIDKASIKQDDEGEVLYPCLKCGEVAAKLTIEDPYAHFPEEPDDEDE